MAGAPYHGWLLAQDRSGESYEVINQARTAVYLSNPSLALDNISICDILAFGGCETYAYGPEHVVVSGGYLDFPPSGANYATIPSGSVPTAAAIPTGTGDITVVACIAPDDWSPASTLVIASRWTTVGAQRGWYFYLSTTGLLSLFWSPDGTNTLFAAATANLSAYANGEKRWVAVTFDVDNGASGRSVRFWQSTDGTTYTQVGSTVTTATPTAIYATTAPVMIGSFTDGSSNNFVGNIYEVSIRNGTGASGVVGGTEVFHFDATTDLVGFSPTKSSPWTIATSSGAPMTIYPAGSPGLVPVPATTRCDLVSQTYSSPAVDPAPWYNANYPESADALGFYVDEWTGLDDGHVRRNTTTIGGPGGGTQMGVVFAEGRTMALNIMLFARSEQAMEYLFRWLSSTLNSICATCATSSVLIRRFCGTTADPWNGVGEMRKVGVVQGLKWESEIGRRARCYIRRASFTLMAGDPCIYLPSTEVPTSAQNYNASLSTFFTANPPDPTRAICRPSCSELTTSARLSRTFTVNPMSAMAPVVTWTNNTSTYTYPFRAIVYFGEHETDDPNPCGMPILGELYVRPLPPSTAMRWDITGRNVEFKDPSTGGWTSSWVYVDANDPPQRRFFALPCGTSHLVMEPATMCADFDGGTLSAELDGISFGPIIYPTVEIALSERISCP